jgi:hypothetical protein
MYSLKVKIEGFMFFKAIFCVIRSLFSFRCYFTLILVNTSIFVDFVFSEQSSIFMIYLFQKGSK